MEGNQLHLSSVIESSSPWKVKSASSYLSKIARMESETAAIILKEDSNKPLRYLYLWLLMNKKNNSNLKQILTRVGQIKNSRESLQFISLPETIASLVPTSIQGLYEQLKELQKKLENHSYAHTAVLKLSHEFAIIDPLLVAVLRVLADDVQLTTKALDWTATLTLPQVELLLQRLTGDKSGVSQGRNRFVLFYPLTQIQYQYFRLKNVAIVRESECFDELSDKQTLRYQDYLIIEKTFSLL